MTAQECEMLWMALRDLLPWVKGAVFLQCLTCAAIICLIFLGLRVKVRK